MFIGKPEQQKFEQTLVMIKPHPELYTNKNQDDFEKIIHEYSSSVSCSIRSILDKTFTISEINEHYSHLKNRPYFADLQHYISSGNSRLLLIEGNNAIKLMDKYKNVLRKTHNCSVGLLAILQRKDPCKNILHASDTQKEAQAEVRRYFPDFYIGK